MTILSAAAVALVVVTTFIAQMKTESLSLVAVALFAMSVVAMVGLSYFITAPAAARRNFLHNKQLHHPMTYSWNAAGLDVRSNGNRSHVEWVDLFRVMENRDVILFFISPQMVITAPKRVLSDAQIDELRQFSSRKQ